MGEQLRWLCNRIQVSLIRKVIHVSSVAATVIARYLASELDLETMGCFLEDHDMQLLLR